MIFSTNYRVVDVKDELPDEYSKTLARSEFGDFKATNGFHVLKNNCTHWLKPVENSIVFTREELEKIIGDAWEQSDKTADERQRYPYGKRGEWEHPDKQQYINQKIKP